MYGGAAHVYTDGSTTSCASAAAFVIPQMTIARRFKIDHKTTSTAAELVAIREAVRFISAEPARRWTIFCDAKAALQTIDCIMRQGPYHTLSTEIAELLGKATKNGHHVAFQWIPAHCGVMGNEEADAEAKTALHNAPEVCIAFSRTDTNVLLRQVMRNSTLEHWKKPERQHKRLHKWDPEMKFRMPHKLKRKMTCMIHRIRLGVAFTRHYAHLIGCSDAGPDCGHCQIPETLEHIFCACPAYARERQELISSIGQHHTRPLTDDVVLGPWPDVSSSSVVIEAVVAFLQATGLDARL